MSYTITDQCNGCKLCSKGCPVSAISGEKKEIHSIDPSLCIECGACGRICKPGAVLDEQGNACAYVKKKLWEKPVFDLKTCSACTACVNVCPTNIIDIAAISKKDTNLYPFLTSSKDCISCSFCFDICASESISMQPPKEAAA